MAVPSKFAREQYAALLAEEKSNRGDRSDLKITFKKTIDDLRKAFTPKPNEDVRASLPSASREWLPQDKSKQSTGFQGGYKLAMMQRSINATPASTVSGSNSDDMNTSGWQTAVNSSGATLLSRSGDADSGREVAVPWDVATPYDSGLSLATPSSHGDVVAAPSIGNSDGVQVPSQRIRRVSHGSIHYNHGEYIRFGSINTGEATIHRAPSVQSQSAVSISNSDLDDAEALAEAFPEVGKSVASSQSPEDEHAHRGRSRSRRMRKAPSAVN